MRFEEGDIIMMGEFIGRVTGMHWDKQWLVYELEELRNGNRPMFGYYEHGRMQVSLDMGIINDYARKLTRLERLILLGMTDED